MLEFHRTSNQITIHYHKQALGHITLYSNPYHQGKTYLTLDLLNFPLDMAELLLQSLLQESELGFQVMLSSDDREKIAFLTAGGFTRRRRCFELELNRPHLLEPVLTHPIHKARRGQDDFSTSAQLMFSHYQATHQAINPWTAGQERFEELLPDTVFYTKQDGQVTNLAFVEDNEIAYMTGRDLQDFQSFINQVIKSLFSQYEIITTEVDDCDPYAMTLLGFCQTPPPNSWDTYLLDKIT